MNLLRNRGLELPPLLPDETPVLFNKLEFMAAAQAGEPNFVRYVRVDTDRSKSFNLPRVLKQAEREFQKIEEICGSATVEHQWYLAERTPPKFIMPNALLPAGQLLVAKVATLQQLSPEPSTSNASEAAQRLDTGISQYRQLDRRAGGKVILDEVYPFQFIFGHPIDQPEQESKFWFVDIEPQLYKR